MGIFLVLVLLQCGNVLSLTINTTSCGQQKSCYRVPSGCQASQCEYLVTWANNQSSSEVVDFEMQAMVRGPQWVAMGLSLDTEMENTSVTECTFDESTNLIAVWMSWNQEVGGELDNVALPAQDQTVLVSSSIQTSNVNGYIRCQFSRYKIPPISTSNKVFPLNVDYNLLMAKGAVAGGEKQYHMGNILASSTKFNFASTVYADNGGPVPKNSGAKAHGCMMISAWIILASIAVLLPRHFKPTWPDFKVFGIHVWFQIHRACMVLVFSLTVIGFILIFIAVGDYSVLPGDGAAHPPLGIIVTAVVFINPIMALFRPHPGTSNRKIFNWAHFIVGQSGHILACTNVFLGLDLANAGAPKEATWVLVALVVVHVLTEVTLLLHQYMTDKGNKPESKKSYNLHSATGPAESSQDLVDDEVKGAKVKTAIFICYVVINIALGITLLVLVGS